MLLYQLLYAVDFISPKPATPLQSDGVKPKFGCVILTLDMNVGWLMTITRIKEKSVRTNSPYCWHYPSNGFLHLAALQGA
jgi:hypothetical protein